MKQKYKALKDVHPWGVSQSPTDEKMLNFEKFSWADIESKNFDTHVRLLFLCC